MPEQSRTYIYIRIESELISGCMCVCVSILVVGIRITGRKVILNILEMWFVSVIRSQHEARNEATMRPRPSPLFCFCSFFPFCPFHPCLFLSSFSFVFVIYLSPLDCRLFRCCSFLKFLLPCLLFFSLFPCLFLSSSFPLRFPHRSLHFSWEVRKLSWKIKNEAKYHYLLSNWIIYMFNPSLRDGVSCRQFLGQCLDSKTI